MITLSPTSALMLYLCMTLGILLVLWSLSHWKLKKREILPPPEKLLVCEYCHSAYMDDMTKEVTKCPECNTFNKNNLFTP